GADDEPVIARRAGPPIITPQRPGQFRSGIIELRFLPVFTVIDADFDPRYPAIAAERHAADRNSFRRYRAGESRFVVGLIEARARRHNEIRAPALFLVKADRAFIGHFDARDPFHMFLAEVTGNNDPRGKSVAVRQGLAI